MAMLAHHHELLSFDSWESEGRKISIGEYRAKQLGRVNSDIGSLEWFAALLGYTPFLDLILRYSTGHPRIWPVRRLGWWGSLGSLHRQMQRSERNWTPESRFAR